jgi:alkylhydroperoxidase family enzyme
VPEQGSAVGHAQLATGVFVAFNQPATSIEPVPPRLALVDPDPQDEVVAAIVARRGGWIATLDKILLHSPPIAEGWNLFYGAIRTETTVSPRIRELAILRVAHLNGDRHNWWHHERIAGDAGLSQAEIEGVRDWQAHEGFSRLERAVLAYTDALTVDVRAQDSVFAAVRDEVTTRQMVEITAIIASYNCVSRSLVGMDIDREM